MSNVIKPFREYNTTVFPHALLKEGITQQDSYITDFLTGTLGTTGVELNVKPYRFLSVLTDGAFNPMNDYDCNYNRCYIGFNSPQSHRLPCNREYYNIPIPYVQRIYWHNEIGNCMAAVQSYEGGYGRVYIIKHNYPFERVPIKKNNPHWCGTLSVAYNTTTSLHAGLYRTNAGHQLIIPFLPYGYEKFSIMVYTVATPFTVNCYQLHCDTSASYCGLNQIDTSCQCNHYNNCSNRHIISVSNGDDFEDPADFLIKVVWLNKSDNTW